MAMLSAGAIHDILNGGTEGLTPTLQISEIKDTAAQGGVAGKVSRYRLNVSDGTHVGWGMATGSFATLIANQQLRQWSVVKLSEYAINYIQGRRIIILLSGDPVANPPYVIGNPQPIIVAASGGADDLPAAAPFGASSGAPPYASAPAPTSSSSSSASSASSSAAVVPRPGAGFGGGGGGFGGFGGGGGYGGAGQVVTPLSALNPYSNRWTIKVRVVSKSDVRTWNNARGSGSMFKVELLDDQGTEIGAAFFKEAVDRFNSVVVAGKVYMMSGGKVKVADQKFSAGRQYEITFDEKSTISLAVDDVKIPKMHYNFTPLAHLADTAKDAVVDVLAVLSEVRDVSQINTKAGKSMTKREVVLLDHSGPQGASSIELTLWDSKATMDLSVGQIVAVKGVKVSDWNTRSLSCWSSTQLAVDPDLDEAHQLRGWHQGAGQGIAPTSLSERNRAGGGGGGGAGSAAELDLSLRHNVAQIKGEGVADAVGEGSVAVIKAGIKHIRAEPEKLAYPACDTAKEGGRVCNKKLENQGGSWSCRDCGIKEKGPDYRYMLSTSLQDASGDTFVTLFNVEAEQLMGIKAGALMELGGVSAGDGGATGEASPDYTRRFQEQLFRQFLFTIKVKLDSYGEQSRLSASVVKMKPLTGDTLVKECRALVAHIKKYLA